MTDILELANVCAAAGGCGQHCPGFDDNTKCFDTSVSHLSPHEIAGHIVAGEQLRAKHAALVEAAEMVEPYLDSEPASDMSRREAIDAFRDALSDLEASDD